MEQQQTHAKEIEKVIENPPEKKKKKKKKKPQAQNNNNENVDINSSQLTDPASQYVIRFIEEHKLAVQLKWNLEKGRHVTSTRSFKPGEVVLEENAYCASPLSIDEDICFHCLQSMEHQKDIVNCTTCSLKGFSVYCSQQCCDNNKRFHDLECPLIEKVISHAVSYTSLDLYKLVLVLRALVRRYLEEVATTPTPSSRFSALLSLETHRDKHEPHQLKQLESSAKFLLLVCNEHSPVKLAPDVTVDQIIDVFLIIKMNAIGLGPRGIGLFLLSSLINHSCLENTNHVQSPASAQISATVQMRAIEPIKSNQEINFSYLDELYEPTNVRNTQLQKTKFFTCGCNRCRDPTEGGRFLRGIKCNTCQTGYYCPKPLPKPLTSKSGQPILNEWKCHSCQGTLPEEDPADNSSNNNNPSNHLTHVNEHEVDALVTEALKKLRESNFETGKAFSEGVDLFEKVINEYSKWYHPYHYTTTLAKVNLTECYMQPSRQNLQRALELADEVIQVGTQILPKYSAVLADFYHTKSTVLRVMAQQARSSAVRKSLLNRGKDVLNTELGIFAVCKGPEHWQYKALQNFIQSYGKS